VCARETTPALSGKVIVLTGGAGLLGRAFAGTIAENGGTAVIASRDLAALQATADDLRGRIGGAAIDCRQLDIGNPDAVMRFYAGVHDAHGRVDAVVNNAFPRNRNFGRRFEDVAYADFCENVSDHLGGTFLMCQKAYSYFKAQGHGNIVNIGSIYGSIAPRFDIYDGTPMTKEIEYAVAKAGILQLTAYLAAYCKGTGIRVNSLSPGGVFDHQPQAFVDRYNALCASKGMLATEDVVGTLLFLLSDASRHITGQNIVVDDGFSL
jgi:NAD(P)-dependent dehydrogenase (short-subunit alcohol dehydrogenase family)